jgi:ABC-2 type transport system permease protein
METYNLFWRNVKWRFQNPITIFLTVIPPIFWLVFYSTVLTNSMGGNYPAFVLAGLLVLVVFSSSGSSGVSNYASKADGSFYRILISPVKRSSIVMGHILDAAVFSFVEIGILLIISFLMSVRITSGLFGFLLMVVQLFFTVFFVASLSYTLSLGLPNENVFHTMMNTFVLPVFFVSTALIPFEKIPVGFRFFVTLNPFTHVINSLRNLIRDVVINWQQFELAACLMLGLGTIFFLLSIKQLDNTRQ